MPEPKPPIISFNDSSIGDFLMTTDFQYAFEVVRSGDVMPEGYGGTMSPESPVMRCYKKSPFVEGGYTIGQLTIDYFETEFYWANKEMIDGFYARLEKEFNSR